MIPKLTHTEACKMVEDALERIGKTLAYIRLKLEKQPKDKPIQLSLFEQNALEKANLLCNINWYGAYLNGVKSTINALREYGLLDIPEQKGWEGMKNAKIYKKAVIDLIMADSVSMDRFLGRDYDEIHFTDHERDKKGKLVKCRAYFAKRVVGYKEL